MNPVESWLDRVCQPAVRGPELDPETMGQHQIMGIIRSGASELTGEGQRSLVIPIVVHVCDGKRKKRA